MSLPVPLLHAYLSLRDHDGPTHHKRNLALLDAAHILHLLPVPDSALTSSRLLPSSPPPTVHFSSVAHRLLFTNHDASSQRYSSSAV